MRSWPFRRPWCTSRSLRMARDGGESGPGAESCPPCILGIPGTVRTPPDLVVSWVQGPGDIARGRDTRRLGSSKVPAAGSTPRAHSTGAMPSFPLSAAVRLSGYGRHPCHSSPGRALAATWLRRHRVNSRFRRPLDIWSRYCGCKVEAVPVRSPRNADCPLFSLPHCGLRGRERRGAEFGAPRLFPGPAGDRRVPGRLRSQADRDQ